MQGSQTFSQPGGDTRSRDYPSECPMSGQNGLVFVSRSHSSDVSCTRKGVISRELVLSSCSRPCRCQHTPWLGSTACLSLKGDFCVSHSCTPFRWSSTAQLGHLPILDRTIFASLSHRAVSPTFRSAIFRIIEISKCCWEKNSKLSLKSLINNKIPVGIKRRKAEKINIDVRILLSYFSVYKVEITELIKHTRQWGSFIELEGTLESDTEHSWTMGEN